MSKTVIFGGWVSIVPDSMVKSWIKKKYIPNIKIPFFGTVSKKDEQPWTIKYRMDNPKSTTWDGEWVTKDKVHELKKKGWEEGRKIILLRESDWEVMKEEVNKWYGKVFDYVEEWLFKSNLLHIEKGSIQSGFCVEYDPEHEVVRDWGAPLAKEGNKVTQMKEKFGRVVVYFHGLTNAEEKKVELFAKEVKKKFDCEPNFW